MAKFVYQQRSKEQTSARANQSGGMYDNPYKDGVQTFSPKEGTHVIRIMPPAHEGADHYGIDVWLHSSVGADNQTYVCPSKMKGEACVLCEEQSRAARSGDTEYADQLKPYKRVWVWVIDRNNEKDGPLLYQMPWTMDKNFVNLAIDKRSGAILPIDHPDEGFDVEFRRDGAGLKTKYTAEAVARKSTPLHDDLNKQDKWLDFIAEKPLPSVVNYFPPEHILKVFEGRGAAPKKRDDDRAAPQTRSDSRRAETREEDTQERPQRRASQEEPPARRSIDDPKADIDTPPRRRTVEETPTSTTSRPDSQRPTSRSEGEIERGIREVNERQDAEASPRRQSSREDVPTRDRGGDEPPRRQAAADTAPPRRSAAAEEESSTGSRSRVREGLKDDAPAPSEEPPRRRRPADD